VTDGVKAQDKVYQLDLGDVLVTKVVEDEGPGLTLSLDYRKIELETFGQDNNGVFGPAGEFGYDLAASKDGVSVPSPEWQRRPEPAAYDLLHVDRWIGRRRDRQAARRLV